MEGGDADVHSQVVGKHCVQGKHELVGISVFVMVLYYRKKLSPRSQSLVWRNSLNQRLSLKSSIISFPIINVQIPTFLMLIPNVREKGGIGAIRCV